MFKNKKSRTVLIVLAVMLALSVTAFGKTVSENAKLFYNNIKIYIDGAEIVPKDAVGNVVEPFIINGTTYLPVRAISNALGKDVEWDGATQSVYIGKKDQTKPDNYLDRIQYNDFVKANLFNALYRIDGSITDYLNETYTNGMLFFTSKPNSSLPCYIEDDRDKAQVKISYPLNSLYKKMSGKVVLPKIINSIGLDASEKYNEGDCEVNVLFYADDRLIKEVKAVTTTMPFDFDLDISGVNSLTIKIKECSYARNTYIALTDLALYK